MVYQNIRFTQMSMPILHRQRILLILVLLGLSTHILKLIRSTFASNQVFIFSLHHSSLFLKTASFLFFTFFGILFSFLTHFFCSFLSIVYQRIILLVCFQQYFLYFLKALLKFWEIYSFFQST